MARFTTRIELHDADGEDYDLLHEEMENRGFLRTVTSSDNEKVHLPTAEYNFDGTATLDQVFEKAKAAAKAVNKKFGMIVTEAKARKWCGLDPA